MDTGHLDTMHLHEEAGYKGKTVATTGRQHLAALGVEMCIWLLKATGEPDFALVVTC